MLLNVHLGIKRHNLEGMARLLIGTLGVLVDREGEEGERVRRGRDPERLPSRLPSQERLRGEGDVERDRF